jgi:uncharacterized protein (TIGR02594 family)
VANYVVLAEQLNVRSGPSITSSVITTVPNSGVVNVVNNTGFWYQVNAPVNGWASHRWLIPQATANSQPWMPIAVMEGGEKGVPGRGGSNPRVLEYLRSTSLGNAIPDGDETPWCSAFVNWCIEQAGLQGSNSAAARSWHNLPWGRAIANPVPGCITVLRRDEAGPEFGHVGFFIRETGTEILLLGGNQGNEVNLTWQSKKRLGVPRLLSHRLP